MAGGGPAITQEKPQYLRCNFGWTKNRSIQPFQKNRSALTAIMAPNSSRNAASQATSTGRPRCVRRRSTRGDIISRRWTGSGGVQLYQVEMKLTITFDRSISQANGAFGPPRGSC